MLLAGGLLGVLYVVFAVVLFQVLNVGLVPMLVIVIGLAVFQYYTSDKLALAAAGAKVVSREDAPQLHDMVERLCGMADLPKPKIAIMTIASFFAMLAAMLTRFGLYGGMFSGGDRRDNNGPPIWLIIFAVSIITYALSFILIRTISRYREYAADRGSALMTGAPEHLMSALQKIASQMTLIPQRDLREVESMNAFFIVPTNVKSAVSELFATHPPMEKRLARLADIAREMGRPVV
jgi:heat shock protein HtpX